MTESVSLNTALGVREFATKLRSSGYYVTAMPAMDARVALPGETVMVTWASIWRSHPVVPPVWWHNLAASHPVSFSWDWLRQKGFVVGHAPPARRLVVSDANGAITAIHPADGLAWYSHVDVHMRVRNSDSLRFNLHGSD